MQLMAILWGCQGIIKIQNVITILQIKKQRFLHVNISTILEKVIYLFIQDTDFCGVVGWERLCRRMKDGRKACDQITHFLKERYTCWQPSTKQSIRPID